MIILFFTLLTSLMANVNEKFSRSQVDIYNGDTLRFDNEEKRIGLAVAKAIEYPANDSWSLVAIFAGSGCESQTTDPFTCDHADWRIRWEISIGHVHFDFYDFLLVTTYPDGEFSDYIDSIHGRNDSDPSVVDNRLILTGVHYIPNNAGKFYMKISSDSSIEHYTIIVEQDPDSPSLTPEPSPGLTIGSDVMVPIIMVVAIVVFIAFFIKFRKK